MGCEQGAWGVGLGCARSRGLRCVRFIRHKIRSEGIRTDEASDMLSCGLGRVRSKAHNMDGIRTDASSDMLSYRQF